MLGKNSQKEEVVHDFASKEFVMFLENSSRAYIKYEMKSNTLLHFLTTQVPSSQQGKGIGKILVKHALDFCVENQMKCSSSCWYINEYITRHPEKKHRNLFL